VGKYRGNRPRSVNSDRYSSSSHKCQLFSFVQSHTSSWFKDAGIVISFETDEKFMEFFGTTHRTLPKLPIKLINKVVCYPYIFVAKAKKLPREGLLSCGARVVQRQLVVKSRIWQECILKFLHASRRWLTKCDERRFFDGVCANLSRCIV